MKAVLDTNIAVSGLLYSGKPHELLQYARNGRLKLYSSPALLVELKEVLARPKFSSRLKLLHTTPEAVLLAYLALIEIVITDKLEPVVVRDQDDDEVMACAIQADVDCVITGDQHLLSIGEYLNINIITAAEAIDVLQA